MAAQGEHPKHRGVSDAALLGTVERYFAEIMPIPRLQQRIDCFILARSFEPAMQRVSTHLSLSPGMLATVHELANLPH